MPERWNQRYATPSKLPEAAYGLRKYSHLLPQHGIGLDLACGLGQNAIFLAKQGLTMHAWDYSKVGLEQMRDHCSTQKVEVNQRCIDLTNEPWPQQKFDLICVTAFLDRSLCPQIVSLLNPGAILVYQTFNQVVEIAGETLSKPSRHQFLLAKGELLSMFNELEPLVYHDEQELSQATHPLAGRALLLARKPMAS